MIYAAPPNDTFGRETDSFGSAFDRGKPKISHQKPQPNRCPQLHDRFICLAEIFGKRRH